MDKTLLERLDDMSTQMFQTGQWDSRLDTVKEAKEYIEKLENILHRAFPEKHGHFFIRGEADEKDSFDVV